jgi:hypothetical protein
MYCNNCGGPNENQYKFCVHCGAVLTAAAGTTPVAPIPAQTRTAADMGSNWLPAEKRTGNPFLNSSLGFTIIGVLLALHSLNWYIWKTTSAKKDFLDNFGQYKATMIAGLILLAATFATAFLFAQKQTYKIAVLVIGVIVVGYEIFNLTDIFEEINQSIAKRNN